MRLACSAEVLARGARVIARVLGQDGTSGEGLPVVVRASGEGVEFVAVSADGRAAVRWRAPAVRPEIAGEGVPVSAACLLGLARSLPPDAEVSVQAQDGALAVVSGAFRCILARRREAFPAFVFESPPGLPALRLKGSEFAAACNGVAFAAAQREDLLPEMFAAVLLEVEEETLRLTATDRLRLATVEVPLEGDALSAPEGKASFSCLVRADRLRAVAALAGGAPEITVVFASDRVFLSFEGVTVCMHAADGSTFPDYRKVFPSDFGAVVVVDAKALRAALRRAATVVRFDNRPAVCFAARDGVLAVSSLSAELGETHEAIQPKEIRGEASARFDLRLISEVLRVFPPGDVELKMNDCKPEPGAKWFPSLLRPVDVPGYACLVMPLSGSGK